MSTHRQIRVLRTLAGALVLLGVGAGCSTDRSAPTAVVRVARLVLTPETTTLDVGDSVQLSASPLDESGQRLERPVTWRGDEVASVSQTGLATALGPGVATITATSEGKSATAQIVVARVHSVSLSPSALTLYPDQVSQLQATLRDASGSPVARTMTWSSDRPGVATVDGDGHVTAIAAGTAAITVTSEQITGAAAVTVIAQVSAVRLLPETVTLAMHETMQLVASAHDAVGLALTRPITYSSDAPAIATVDAMGRVTPVSPGVASITATSEGQSAKSTVVVLAPIGSVTVEPEAPVIYTGKSLRLSALVKDADGAPLVRQVTWASRRPGVATVDASGTVRGLRAGTATITATSAGIVGAANLTVLAPIVSIDLSPPTANLTVGDTLQLTPMLLDAAGLPLSRPLTWTSETPAVATVSGTGRVTGVSPGVAIVRVSVEGFTATTTLTVLAPVASLTVLPTTGTVNVGASLKLSSVAKDALGNVLVREVSWSSNRVDRASVDANGLVIGVATGAVVITAQIGTKTATAAITVVEPVASLRLTATSDSIEVGASVRLIAETLDRAGTAVTRSVTWTTSAAAIVSVDASGLATGVSPGAATVTAQSETISASKTIRVLFPVAAVSIVSTVTTLSVGQTVTLAALPRDDQGQPIARSVSWMSSNPVIATVSQRGVVTGRSTGSVTITAMSGTKRAQTVLTVQSQVARVVVTASSATITSEDSVATVTAVVYDANNVVLQRDVSWASSDPNVATVSPTGSQTAEVKFRGSGTATITATSEGQSGSVAITAMGPPTETVGNNLSWPTIFTEGLTIAGAPVGIDAGLRPLPAEGIPADTLPFWYHLNHPDWLNSYYTQGTENVWRAEWLDGSSTPSFSADVAWGDNVTHHSYNTHATIHIEVSLYARSLPTMRGFNMFTLSGSGSTEIKGTDGTVGHFQPGLFTVTPRLLIEKLDSAGGTPIHTVVNQTVADGLGSEGPGSYAGELNQGGRIVYGYNLVIKNVTFPSGMEKYGWFRLNFILENQVTVNGATILNRVWLDGLATGDDTETPTFIPQLDPNRRRSFVDIYITSASGGHSDDD